MNFWRRCSPTPPSSSGMTGQKLLRAGVRGPRSTLLSILDGALEEACLQSIYEGDAQNSTAQPRVWVVERDLTGGCMSVMDGCVRSRSRRICGT